MLGLNEQSMELLSLQTPNTVNFDEVPYTFFKTLNRSKTIKTSLTLTKFPTLLGSALFKGVSSGRRISQLRQSFSFSKTQLSFKLQPKHAAGATTFDFFVLTPFKKKIFSCTSQLLLNELSKIPGVKSKTVKNLNSLRSTNALLNLYTNACLLRFLRKSSIKLAALNNYVKVKSTRLDTNSIKSPKSGLVLNFNKKKQLKRLGSSEFFFQKLKQKQARKLKTKSFLKTPDTKNSKTVFNQKSLNT